MMSQATNHKYQVRVNANPPSKKQMQEHKDFHKLMLQYKRTKRRKPLHSVLGRVNKLMPLIIIILSLLVILLFYIQFAKQHQKKELPTVPQSQVEVDNAYQPSEYSPNR